MVKSLVKSDSDRGMVSYSVLPVRNDDDTLGVEVDLGGLGGRGGALSIPPLDDRRESVELEPGLGGKGGGSWSLYEYRRGRVDGRIISDVFGGSGGGRFAMLCTGANEPRPRQNKIALLGVARTHQ